MTISTQVAEVTLPGNGSGTSFAFSFLIPEATDAVVTITVASVDTVLTSAQYSITGLGDEAGGIVTYPLSGSPLAVGSTITIQRVLPITQSVDLINQGLFDPEVIEGEFDYLTMLVQQMQYQIDGTAVPSVSAVTPPQGRLSLTSGVPVTVAAVSAAANVFYEPFAGALLPLWDGSTFIMTLFTEITLALDSNSGHTGYHQSGKNFDVFGISASSIGTGPAWTSDTGRGSGAGTTELELKNGIWTNKNSITLRTGSASGNTVVVAANAATYLGSFRCTANGQTEDSSEKRFLFNAYNRTVRRLLRQDTTNTWNYSTAAFQQANASTSNQVAMLRGLNEDDVSLRLNSTVINSTSTARLVIIAIGLDSVAAKAADCNNCFISVLNIYGMLQAEYAGYPGLGYHYLAWLEYGGGTDTQTWQGDANGALVQSGLAGWCRA